MEHFNTGNGGGLLLIGQTDDFNHIRYLNGAALHTTRSNRTTAGNGEHVLNRHQERQVGLTLGSGNIAVNSVHQLPNALVLGSLGILVGGFERVASGTADDWNVIAREVVGRKQIANFHLNEVEQFGVVHEVGLVQEHDDRGNADLTSEQNVLAGLLERSVGTRNHEDRAVHLRRTRDHVLHVVGVAGAVHVSIVTLVGFILNVTGVDCDTSCLLFGRVVDLVISQELDVTVFESESLGDRCGQGGFAVVNVTDGTDVDVRLGAFKCSLCHFEFPPFNKNFFIFLIKH